MAIVASESGGPVSCSDSNSVKALSWAEADGIASQFERLNPYDRAVVKGSILKVEEVNRTAEGIQRQLYGYGIAAKRYSLFTYRPDDSIRIEKASAHGLGFLFSPKRGFDHEADAPLWVVEAWTWILQEIFGIPQSEPSWFDLPAMMRFTITTPEVLKVLQARQRDLPYRDRAKPFNFVLSPMIDPIDGHPTGTDHGRFTLIAPYCPEPSRWFELQWINVHDGKRYQLARPGKRFSYQADFQKYGDLVRRYRWHPEARSLAPDGSPCTSRSQGLLKRTPVIAALPFRYIGKETDRRWEQGEDISILVSTTLEYRPNETARLMPDPVLQRNVRSMSIRALAKTANVSDKTVKAARSGQRLRRSTISKLEHALRSNNGAKKAKKARSRK